MCSFSDSFKLRTTHVSAVLFCEQTLKMLCEVRKGLDLYTAELMKAMAYTT
jgi:hypothetical protein